MSQPHRMIDIVIPSGSLTADAARRVWDTLVTNAILPCPFCGGRALLKHLPADGADGVSDFNMAVQCQTEGCWATIRDYIGGDDSASCVVAAWTKRTQQGEVMTTLTARHLADCDCPAEHHAELLRTGLTAEHLEGLKAEEVKAGKKISWIAALQFIRKYKALGLEIIAAIPMGVTAVLTIITAHIEQWPTILADFLAIFA